MLRNSDIPTQVRIRTDPDEDLGYRYETIQDAKDALGKGNNTATILAACEHAQQDVKAKADALEYLRRHVPAPVVEEVADRLSTREMDVEYTPAETEVRTDD